MVGVDAALDYPLFNALKPVVKGLAAPTTVVSMFEQRKAVEQDIVSSHGDATRFFVTFLDNHDMKERVRYVDPADEHRFDDQVTLGLACLYALPGISCLYYGTEQGLHGVGSDPAVREALWGSPAGFDETSWFYQALQRIGSIRSQYPALRYGRYYFRPISGDGQNFGFSPYPGGVLAWSRILADLEITVVANTSTGQGQQILVIVDENLNPIGAAYRILYTNKATPVVPGVSQQIVAARMQQLDGTVTEGTIRAVPVSLQPMEIQILGR